MPGSPVVSDESDGTIVPVAVVVGQHRQDGARAFGHSLDHVLLTTHDELVDDVATCFPGARVAFLGVAAGEAMFGSLPRALDWLRSDVVGTLAIELPDDPALRSRLRDELTPVLTDLGAHLRAHVRDFGAGPCLVLGAEADRGDRPEDVFEPEPMPAAGRARQHEEAAAWELAAATSRSHDFERRAADGAAALKRAQQKIRLLEDRLKASKRTSRSSGSTSTAADRAHDEAPTGAGAATPVSTSTGSTTGSDGSTAATGPGTPTTDPGSPARTRTPGLRAALHRASGVVGARSSGERATTLLGAAGVVMLLLAVPPLMSGLLASGPAEGRSSVLPGLVAALVQAAVVLVAVVVLVVAGRRGTRRREAESRSGTGKSGTGKSGTGKSGTGKSWPDEQTETRSADQ